MSVLNGGYDPNQDAQTLEALFNIKLRTKKFYQRTFLVRVIHILWMEKNGQLPWSIKNYSNNEINALFFEPTVNYLTDQLKPVTSINSVDASGFNYFEDYEPQLSYEASYKLHKLALKFLGDTEEKLIKNATRWIKTNFFHAYSDPPHGVSWGFDHYTGKKPYTWMPSENNRFPLNIEQLFDERISGCHEPALILTEMLRSLNIPALILNLGEHAVVYTPSMECFIHGDYLATRPIVPIESVLLSANEVNQYITTNYDYNKILDDKLSLTYNLWQRMMLTTGIQRTNSTLSLGFNANNEENQSLIPIIQTEAPQYKVQYDSSTHALISQAIPILPLSKLSSTRSVRKKLSPRRAQ